MFLKLDFEKAFDQVNHNYIWETMLLLGVSSHLIFLIRSLVSNASSRVHGNGCFTREILMLRGVRQGCPQPLMDYLDSEIKAGWVRGLQILETLMICFRLFEDDLGILIPAEEEGFLEVKAALELYELASGAKLNLKKSRIGYLSMAV